MNNIFNLVLLLKEIDKVENIPKYCLLYNILSYGGHVSTRDVCDIVMYARFYSTVFYNHGQNFLGILEVYSQDTLHVLYDFISFKSLVPSCLFNVCRVSH